MNKRERNHVQALAKWQFFGPQVCEMLEVQSADFALVQSDSRTRIQGLQNHLIRIRWGN